MHWLTNDSHCVKWHPEPDGNYDREHNLLIQWTVKNCFTPHLSEYIPECHTVAAIHIWKTPNVFTKLSEHNIIDHKLFTDTYAWPCYY